MLRRLPVPFGAVALLGLAACASSTEPTDPALRPADARQAAALFASINAGATRTAPVTTETPDGLVTNCANGGQVRISIPNNRTPVIRANVVFADCAVADSAGQLWIFTSLPRLDMTFTTTSTDTTLALVSTTAGALRVESSRGVRGRCAIDTRLEALQRFVPPQTLRIRQTGQVCGQMVDTLWTGTP